MKNHNLFGLISDWFGLPGKHPNLKWLTAAASGRAERQMRPETSFADHRKCSRSADAAGPWNRATGFVSRVGLSNPNNPR